MHKMNGSFVIDRVRLRLKRRAKFTAADNIEKNDNFRVLVCVDAVRPRDKRACIKPSGNRLRTLRERALEADLQYAGELSVDSLVLGHLTLRQRVHHGVGFVVVIAQHVPVHVVHELPHPGIGPVDFRRAGGGRGHCVDGRERIPAEKPSRERKKKENPTESSSCRTPETTTTTNNKMFRVSSKYCVVVINY